MEELVHTLGAALAASAGSLHEAIARRHDPEHQALQARLDALRSIGAPDSQAAFARALERAARRLRRAQHDPQLVERLLALLAAEGEHYDLFRRVGAEELILSNLPTMGRLLDIYRRLLRPEAAAAGGELPAWNALAPALALFLHALLPRALAEQHALRPALPTPAERALLDALRAERAQHEAARQPASAALLAALGAQQSIVAAEGGTISEVRQTIVYGDLHAPAPAPPADLEALYRRYCAFLIETFGTLDFRGIMQVQHVTRLPLEAIYVPPIGQIDDWPYEVAPPPPAGSAPAPSAQRLPSLVCLHEALRDTPFLVVLGNPGAGKSMFVRHTLLALARGEGRRLGLDARWLPIFFPIAAFAEARGRPGGGDLAPLDYLREYYMGLSQPDYSPLFARALTHGQGLVLLDGLDEVRAGRLELTRCLEAFVREWDAPGNRFVATSRIAGYEDAPLAEALFVRATIQPFDDADIDSFIERWSAAYARAGQPPQADWREAALELERRAAAHGRSLRAAVFASSGVTALARNPLLLTILALIHNQGAQLPDRRADLYRLCVEALAETWNRARSLSGREVDVYLGDEKIDERFVVNLLGPAALWLHGEQPGGLVEQDELERHLADTLMQTDGLPRGRAQRLAQSFIELMRRDTGLLQERGYRRFGFMHLTFEEYLAARALLESVTVADPDALFHRCCAEPRWREVVRLAVTAAPQREAQRLLLHMLDAPTPPTQRGRPVVLAGECLRDIGHNGATQRAWAAVEARLVALLADGEVPLATRVAAGETLGHLGDPRLLDPATGEAAHAPSYWCALGAGPFWHSPDEGNPGARMPLERRALPADLRLARYPVTNAEYSRFVEAGGYDERRWWSDDGWQFLREAAGGPRAHPALWDAPAFNGPSQPVVGVSWYEAAAFCRWLEAEGRRAGWLPPQARLRLPTALEWERAARHTDRRRFPWGDGEPDAERANYDATGLRAPAPVGCFPTGAAACGALDLAGNVWEWTATPWGQSHSPAPRADLAPDQTPIICGGAFNWDASYLRCEARYWFNPGQRHNLLGFRLAWANDKGHP
jgi:formylglycine-generating enzyme required for sulfatase activity